MGEVLTVSSNLSCVINRAAMPVTTTCIQRGGRGRERERERSEAAQNVSWRDGLTCTGQKAVATEDERCMLVHVMSR